MPDNINFNSIPTGIRVPGFYVEIDPSRAVTGPAQIEHRLLLIGQRLSAGLVPADKPFRVLTADQVARDAGEGSHLHVMAQAVDAAKKLYGPIEVWGVALDDADAAAKATGKLTFTGTASESGIVTAWIGHERVRAAVIVGDTAEVIAAKLATAINAVGRLPVTASAADGVVTLSARNAGSVGNTIPLRAAYYDDDTLPAGLTVAVAPFLGGAADPNVAEAIAAMAGVQYYSIAMPYTDAANMRAMEDELAGRWGPMQQRTGHVFVALDQSFAQNTTWGSARNSPHCTAWGITGSPSWQVYRAAAWAAVAEYSGAIDPARPLRELTIPGVLAPAVESRYSFDETDLLLRSGISTSKTASDGTVIMQKCITTYQRNTFGLTDVSLLRLETKWTADYYRYAFRARFAQRYPRHKLADDGGNYAPGQPIITPKLARAECVAFHQQMIEIGIAENLEQFKRDVIVERSTADRNRLNIVLPPDLINQFDVLAASVQYVL